MIWVTGQLLQSGEYQIIEQIGSGGFGLTYLAENQRLNRQVVIKTPNRTFRQEQDYERFVRRFQREGQALAKITHPNVVRVIDLFQEAGMPCLVMEYVAGETLNQCIRRIGHLTEEDAVRYFRQLAAALQIVHQSDLIHCDVHPGNIILKQGQEPTLIDFGSAKSLLPTTFTVTTTFNDDFAPYEQRRGDPQATWDIYGLAATLYFAVTGQKPRAAIDRKVYDDNLMPPKAHRPELSDWLNEAILCGMALEASERSPSMRAWLGLLHPPQPKSQPVVMSLELVQLSNIPIMLSEPFPSAKVPLVRLQISDPLVSLQPLRLEPLSRSEATKPSKSIQQSKPSIPLSRFPWIALCVVLLGYMPTGIMIGESNGSLLAMAGAMFGAIAGAMFGAMAVAWSWSETVAVAMVVAGAGTGAVITAVVVTGTWAGVASVITGAWTLAMAGALVGAESVAVRADSRSRAGFGARATAAAGALLGGSILGYFTKIGIWAGVGSGVSVTVQIYMLIGGIVSAEKAFKERYRRLTIFLIYSVFSTIGLALGAGIGVLLKLAEVD
jgi:serine/threonine protein kinase